MMEQRRKIIERINENKYVKQTKKSVVSLLFGRAGIFLLLILLQIAFLTYLYRYMNVAPTILIGGESIATILLMLIILNMDSITESNKLSRFMLIALVPTFATATFLLAHFSLGYRREQKKVIEIEKNTRLLHNRNVDIIDNIYEEDRSFYNFQNYLYDLGGFPVYNNTSTKYYPVGEDVFSDILKDIKEAKEFIFIEIFIIDYGYMWGTVLEELVKKVEEGVEVRLLIDGTNLLTRVKYNFPKTMKSLGINCRVFSPIYPVVSTYSNNRDHRKIFVIDNKVGFTGGINLADEYINVFERFGHRKDCGLRLEGAAVESLTIMFLQMRNTRNKIMEDFTCYLKPYHLENAMGYSIPFGDNPVDTERFGKDTLLDMLNNAKDYVYLMSPYLIVDQEIISAIVFASKRGLDIRISLPHIPDKYIAFALAKTHYKTLLNAGVRIYEYTPGFTHSKTWLCDDKSGMVGTINLDYRSLYLNFECGVFLYKTEALREMKEDFEVFFNIAESITLEDVSKIPLFQKVVGILAKPFAPLM